MRIGLFVPCFVDAFYPEVAVATLQLLEHFGLQVHYPAEQTCCGQGPFNAGHWDLARPLARRFCDTFDSYDCVVAPSGSCVAMVRNHYDKLVRDCQIGSRTFELCEFIVGQLGRTNLGAHLQGRAVLHIGCHQRRELQAADAVLRLAQSVQGLTLVETESDPWCCGFGGTFSVKYPEVSSSMAERKLQPILKADIDHVITTDCSCLMQLSGWMSRRKLDRPKPWHIAQVLATCLEAS